MKIEVGKTYKTQKGYDVTIVADDYGNSKYTHRYLGVCRGTGTVHTINYNEKGEAADGFIKEASLVPPKTTYYYAIYLNGFGELTNSAPNPSKEMYEQQKKNLTGVLYKWKLIEERTIEVEDE